MNHEFKLHSDGTLEITMPKGVKVGRVLVQEEMSQNGALYYLEGDVPEINVGDMISRKDAIDLVKDVCDAIMSGCDSHYDSETGDEVYNDIREVDAILKCNKEIRIALANMPSAQPEIIRCKDCKWKQGSECVRFAEVRPFPDDFCSRAERRTK